MGLPKLCSCTTDCGKASAFQLDQLPSPVLELLATVKHSQRRPHLSHSAHPLLPSYPPSAALPRQKNPKTSMYWGGEREKREREQHTPAGGLKCDSSVPEHLSSKPREAPSNAGANIKPVAFPPHPAAAHKGRAGTLVLSKLQISSTKARLPQITGTAQKSSVPSTHRQQGPGTEHLESVVSTPATSI